MSESVWGEELGFDPAQQALRSSVKIEQNAKGNAQVRVSVYEGAAQEEMQRLKDLAIQTYLATVRELGMSPVAGGR